MKSNSKVRKTHSGKIYDKERTKRKLISTVGKIIKTQGYTNLRVNRIASLAGVDKKLIYLYFGNAENLIETYLKQNDYWKVAERDTANAIGAELTKDVVAGLLREQYHYFERSEEMQKIILWELSEHNDTLREIVDQREAFGTKLFKIADKQFRNSKVSFRAVNAILVAAIYYLVLHSKSNGSSVCEIDINKPKGKKLILDTVDQILEWVYQSAEKDMQKNKRD